MTYRQPEPRRRSTRRSSDRRRGRSADERSRQSHTKPYIIEWTGQTRRQRTLLDLKELREEITQPDRDRQRVLVMRGDEGEMAEAVSIETGMREKGKRWAWEFPEGGDDGQVSTRSGRLGICICRVSLLTSARIPILVLDGLAPGPPKHRSDGRTVPGTSALEYALWQTIDDGRPLEMILAELVYDAWLDALQSATSSSSISTQAEVLQAMARALEVNSDMTRAMHRSGRALGLEAVTAADWTTQAERAHRYIQLGLAISVRHGDSSSSSSSGASEVRDANVRRLDRITYLGGLLLPMTIVSGVLSINGAYGPGGSEFWLFWVAAGLSSLLALLVIYVDNLRGIDVWMEVAAGEALGLDTGPAYQHYRQRRRQDTVKDPRASSDDFKISGGGGGGGGGDVGDAERGEARLATAADGCLYVVQRRADGSRARTWRRRELGWAGAAKKMCGWYYWRDNPGVAFRPPGQVAEMMQRR